MKFFPTFLLALLALPLAALAAPPTPVSVESAESAEATEAAEAAEAAEVAEAAEAGKECTIHARWEGTWIEYGLSRYRVRMWNEGGERNLTDHLCVFFWIESSFDIISNPKCWYDLGHAVGDVSFGRGPTGHGQYKKTFSKTFKALRKWHGCKLDVQL